MISLDFNPVISHAAWQNSVPVVRALSITNGSGDAVENLTVSLTTQPALIADKSWKVDRILPGQTVSIADRDLTIHPDYLRHLNEAERGLLTLTLTDRSGSTLDQITRDFRILANNEWGGCSDRLDLLAAFVMPNDRAIAGVLKDAAGILKKHGAEGSLDGYQSRDSRKVWQTAAAVWSAVSARQLTYVLPPPGFEENGQKVRTPQQVLADKLATCLDSTSLFCSTLEAAGFNTVIILQQGHCFAGVWLKEKTAGQMITSDVVEVRKALAGKELITFETTLVTSAKPASFESGIQRAAAETSETGQHKFVAMLDIGRARMNRIRPLVSGSGNDMDTEESGGEVSGLSLAPDLSDEPAEEPLPTTPQGRVERWHRKLLDLSLRNKLLNFRMTLKSVPFLCTSISLLEDLLSDGKTVRIVSLPEQLALQERDSALHQQRTGEDLTRILAEELLKKGELASPLEDGPLKQRLTELYRQARNDLAEGGSNTLYLAVGFLKWKKRPQDTAACMAPLLLVPVRLGGRSAVSSFELRGHEDEVRFNATLIQMLKRDFDCDLSRFEADLPTDDSGLDVPRVLAQVRTAIRDVQGMEVVDETALATFSFSRYLMWRDLVDRLDQLEQNRVIRHLIRDPDQPFSSGAKSPIPVPRDIDGIPPWELVCPLPADSTQLTAVAAAAAGHDFVLIGPPGTGKSQTIANIIAQCLSMKRSVLFVAEKTAALDVVHRRLKHLGLGDCCLELHSSKAERKHVLQQLQSAWLTPRRGSKRRWKTLGKTLGEHRDRLNSFAAALHEHRGSWNVFTAAGECVKHPADSRLTFAPPRAASASAAAEEFERLEACLKTLGATSAAVDLTWPLNCVRATDWSNQWEQRLLESVSRLETAAQAMRQALKAFASIVALPIDGAASGSVLEELSRLSSVLQKAAAADCTVALDRQFPELQKGLSSLEAAVSSLRSAHSGLKAVYPDSILPEIPIADLDRQWREATIRFWPLSWFGCRSVRRMLQTYAERGTADPQTDLPLLRSILQFRQQIREHQLALHPRFSEMAESWQTENADLAPLKSVMELAAAVRSSIWNLQQQTGQAQQVAVRLKTLLADSKSRSELQKVAREYHRVAKLFSEAVKDYRATAGVNPFEKDSPDVIAGSLRTVSAIRERRTSLRPWTAWCGARHEVIEAGLEPFLEALEQGRVSRDELLPSFRLAWLRWWVPLAVDQCEPLRSFQGFQYEDLIRKFCSADDDVLAEAAACVLQAISHDLPKPDEVSRSSELGFLRHQMQLKRPSKSIRELIQAMPSAFRRLAPCVLMSPLSIAQYLAADYPPFDVVVFDEASQITTWDAIGAIARGRQTIIVGDPKQLPPTSFFSRSETDDGDDSIAEYERDLESILDEAVASGIPTLQLDWHYRSRHESLIAFSNQRYYQNSLVTFPSAVTTDRAVRMKHLPQAVYDRGNSRTNRDEAQAIVSDAVALMSEWLRRTEDQRPTLGVVTFNVQQQSLIQDLFDQACRDKPELEWFFSDDRIEPVAVKNLENVQGDERDIMFFSITFGTNEKGRVPLTFGALNRDGGERRLNVAVTRARRELVVYSSITGDQIAAERTRSQGVRDLKQFLLYARHGVEQGLANEPQVNAAEVPDLIRSVADFLQSEGWHVRTGVGAAGFRIDLAVVHPADPERYLAAIECDGPAWHQAATVRDREKTRHGMLKSLGWNVIRIWTLDWWYDHTKNAQQLHKILLQLSESETGDCGKMVNQ